MHNFKKIDWGTVMTGLICFFFFFYYVYEAVKYNSVPSLLLVVIIIELYNFYIHIQIFDAIAKQEQLNKTFINSIKNHQWIIDYIFAINEDEVSNDW